MISPSSASTCTTTIKNRHDGPYSPWRQIYGRPQSSRGRGARDRWAGPAVALHVGCRGLFCREPRSERMTAGCLRPEAGAPAEKKTENKILFV